MQVRGPVRSILNGSERSCIATRSATVPGGTLRREPPPALGNHDYVTVRKLGLIELVGKL